MFQPGEEGFHGARFMLEDGLLGGTGGDPLPDAAFALHVMPNAPHGLVTGRAGPLMAAADQFDIVVEGRGGHASMPHQTLDPVPVACEIVTALQTLVTRQFDAGPRRPTSADDADRWASGELRRRPSTSPQQHRWHVGVAPVDARVAPVAVDG